MPANAKQLTFADVILNRSGTVVFRILLVIFGGALQLFFRRIETVNADTVPTGTGVIFVLNHPNGLIDPALVFVALPRKIAFLAKSTLFRMPVISFLLKTVEALPVYRRTDAGEDISQNLKTFEAAHERLRASGSIALFPEGISHNSPKLLPMKTGAARIALGSVNVAQGDDPIEVRIVPVGLYYTNKTTFRSEALLHFGEAFTVEPTPSDETGQPEKEAVQRLTKRIEEALREVTVNAENEAELRTAGIAEEIFSTTAETDDLQARLKFTQDYLQNSRTGGAADPSDFERRLNELDADLTASGIDAEHLSLARFTRGFVIKRALLETWYLLMLLPVAVIGAVLHFPAYQISKLLSRIYARHGADDVASTVKVLAGILFMPLTWFITAGVVYYFWGLWFALATIPAAFFSGWVALITLESFEELRGWGKAILLFFGDKDRFLRLYVRRRELQEDLAELEAGRTK
ncbi:hypothetical protein BH24ACI3_BH24ACI3_02880 [soil metagenome]